MAPVASKRMRSPNYPSLGLREAVDKVRVLHELHGQHPMTREIVAKGMGYGGLSGASATAISALNKYGLLDGRVDEIRVSDRAMAILYAHSDDERREALYEAALEPPLFKELSEKFPGTTPNDDLLKSYLLRNKFAHGAVSNVISAYKETAEFAGVIRPTYDSASSSPPAEAFANRDQDVMTKQTTPHAPLAHRQSFINAGERQVGVNDLEGGAYVKIVASENIDTEEALEWAQDIIDRKRRELERLKKRAAHEALSANRAVADKDADDDHSA